MFIPVAVSAQKKAAPSPDAQQMLAVQVALDRAGFSPGEIDGRGGPKTRLALSAFQKSASVQPTGVVSEETLAALRAPAEPVVTYTITAQDVAGPFIGAMPSDMMERAKLPALAYTAALEALAEKFHASPALLLLAQSWLLRGRPATRSKCRTSSRSSCRRKPSSPLRVRLRCSSRVRRDRSSSVTPLEKS